MLLFLIGNRLLSGYVKQYCNRIGYCYSAVTVDVKRIFIINDKNATAREITSLITMIKNAVYAQYGILLEEEIRYLK